MEYVMLKKYSEVLAYVIGQRHDSVLLQLKSLLAPFLVRHFFTDGWGGYERHIEASQLSMGNELARATQFNQYLFNEKFNTLINDFLSWDKSIVDYCDPLAPGDSQWDNKQQ